PWNPDHYTHHEPQTTPARTNSPWRTSSICTYIKQDGKLVQACVSVAIITIGPEEEYQLNG
ncbi:hypothetical protein, partial [Actinoallomurus spadix]